MATSKRGEVKRLADRSRNAPPREAGADDTSAGLRRASPSHPSQHRLEPRGRGTAGGKLRGHLVPHALHADARRLKLSQQAQRGQRVTWDDVATEALELLVAQRGELDRRLVEVRRLADHSTVGPRLIQATIPLDLDQALGELRLDLADEFGHDVPYEQLWAAALLIWLRANR